MTRSVLIIGNFLSAQSGSRGVCEDLADRLAGRGWRVLTTSRQQPKVLRLANMLLTAAKHRHEYTVAQIDVFSGPAFFWAEAVALTLRRLNKPYVLTLHGGNLPEFAARWPRRVRRLFTSAKVVTAPSGFLKDKLEPYCPAVRVIPNPIALSLYPCRERSPARPRLIWLRAFHEIYNPVMAVKVVSELVPKYADVQLIMVGPDKRDGSLERTRTEVCVRTLPGRVRFYGQVAKKQVPDVLSKADIFLNTANVDNAPVSVIEAMACGLCVVSTRPGGIPYLINNGKDGLLVECGDAHAMALMVARLVEDTHLARRCSREARQKVEAWDWASALSQWDGLLMEAQL